MPLFGNEERARRLSELEAQKVRLFEELGRVAEEQKRLAAEMRRIEKEQRRELGRGAEHPVPEDPDLADLEAWAESVYWSHARTMLGNPHMYANKKRCRDPRSYERVVAYVLRNGRPQRYGGATYTVLDFTLHGQPYFCWPMIEDVSRLSDSRVLNAKPLSLAPQNEAEEG